MEVLEVRQGEVALPVQMLSPQGHSVTLDYAAFGTEPLLSRITNDTDGTPLLSLLRTTNLLKIALHPGSTFEALFQMSIIGGESRTLELPTADKASWRFDYIPESGLTCLKNIYTPTGGHETVTYSARPHYFPGVAGRTLPRVYAHVRDPGFGQPAIETRYEYDPTDNNFLGFGSGLSWSDDGLDNLYKVSSVYEYHTREILWDASADKAVRETKRVYNRLHLLTLEETLQYSHDPARDDTLKTTETEYHFNPLLAFEDQPNYCQLPKTVTQTWRHASTTQPRHVEVVRTTFDDFGNLLTQINANGVTETSEWYAAPGEVGCPADPQGFVRNLKSKTVTPAASQYGKAPTLRTDYTYTAQPGLTGHGPWLAPHKETLKDVRAIGNLTVQERVFQYFSTPTNPFEHGRKLQDAVTLNGNTTATDFVYSLAKNARNGETVLRTVNTVTGFDGEQKIVTQEHLILNGEPVLERDDNDVEIAYIYDVLGRVTKETVAPGTPYEASRTYTYGLTNAVGQQAKQTACNVKGVTTTTWLDGFNRPIKEARQDADAAGFDPNDPPRLIYEATYDNREQLATETVIDWEGPKDVFLISRFNYDDWGEQRSVIRPDGVEEHEVNDPVGQTTSQWLEVSGKGATGKTVTANNLFEKPDSIKRYLENVDPAVPGSQPYSEHVYNYDGLGRTAEEFDAVSNKTVYEYDVFDRMVKTVLPDFNEVTREYAPHSSKDLPITISVNSVELGTQAFDGQDRMIVSVTGGRRSEYRFAPGQTQPKSVLRPSGLETKYVYRPELGEDPEQRIAVESTADYVYDAENARLTRTEELDANGIKHVLQRTYFSTGELKSERREQTGEPPREMHYSYSRQARLLSYIDVLGQTQTYTYNTKAQLTQTSLGNTISTFAYNDLAQLSSITTVDGAQSLVTCLEYDDFARETLRTFDFGNGVIQTLAQTYDEVDRLTHRVLQEGSETLRDETYAYDERGRLVDYVCVGDQCPVDPYGKKIDRQTFGFDALDNINFLETRFAGGRHSIIYEFNNPSDPCQLTGLSNTLVPADPSHPARIDFAYDAGGNLVSDEAGRVLGYDSLSRLVSVSDVSGGPASKSYGYDTLDSLSSSHSAGAEERRFYKDDEIVNLIRGADSNTFMRGEQVVLAEHQAGAGPKSLILACDDKNTVLSGVEQNSANDIVYSAYGHRSAAQPVITQVGYNGELHEAQTGWQLLGKGYRAFNSVLMRFHSADSWSPFGRGGLNWYVYCLGNPIAYKDPTGHFSFGVVMRFFGIATKANKSARKLAKPALQKVFQNANDGISPLKNSGLSREAAVALTKSSANPGSAKFAKQALYREDLYQSNNRWIQKVEMGNAWAKPDLLNRVVAQNNRLLESSTNSRELLAAANRPGHSARLSPAPSIPSEAMIEHPLVKGDLAPAYSPPPSYSAATGRNQKIRVS
ncbi:RHS repeat-associated core domain-containing protein [Pseudomonas sp. PB3P13]